VFFTGLRAFVIQTPSHQLAHSRCLRLAAVSPTRARLHRD
jgi:hypothetical protein